MSGMQAQCWFWVCPDCKEVIESIRETHCDGAAKGLNRITPPAGVERADDNERGGDV